MVIAESLLCQTPVVALATPWDDNSQGEVVGHEIGGIFANTPSDIRKAIKLLANDKQKRIQYGARGRKRIINHYLPWSQLCKLGWAKTILSSLLKAE